MSTRLIKSTPIAEYKKQQHIDRLDIFTSRKTGKKYATHPDGEFVGMLDKEFDPNGQNPSVVTVTSNDTGETWSFISNSEPRTPDYSL